jgi:hypothetical protein
VSAGVPLLRPSDAVGSWSKEYHDTVMADLSWIEAVIVAARPQAVGALLQQVGEADHIRQHLDLLDRSA